MPTAAIIGASRGIGLGLAREYAAAGWRVHATTRTPDRPGVLGDVRGDVLIHELEVTDRTQQRALGAALAGRGRSTCSSTTRAVYGTWMRAATVNRINAEAPFEVVEALMDAVLRSDQKKIALISSQVGARRGSRRSLGKYGDSKAALNDRFRALERDWRAAGCLAVVIHPGWVRTDMGGSSASLSVEESALRHPARDGGSRRVGPRPLPDLGRARASVVAAASPECWPCALVRYQAASQFSTRKSGTRRNSRSFPVTIVRSAAHACAAIRRSLGPITSPADSRWARIRP